MKKIKIKTACPVSNRAGGSVQRLVRCDGTGVGRRSASAIRPVRIILGFIGNCVGATIGGIVGIDIATAVNRIVRYISHVTTVL